MPGLSVCLLLKTSSKHKSLRTWSPPGVFACTVSTLMFRLKAPAFIARLNTAHEDTGGLGVHGLTPLSLHAGEARRVCPVLETLTQAIEGKGIAPCTRRSPSQLDECTHYTLDHRCKICSVKAYLLLSFMSALTTLTTRCK